MKKRSILAILLAMLLALTMLAGCGATSKSMAASDSAPAESYQYNMTAESPAE